MNKSASSVGSATEQTLITWGKFIRAQHLRHKRAGGSEPELEYLINHQAPLPPPTVLLDYDNALPGTADRIVNLLEQHEAHRRALETRKAEAEITRTARRELYVFLIGLIAVVGSIALLWSGQNLTGTIAFITTLAGLAGAAIGRRARANQKRIHNSLETSEFGMQATEYVSDSDDKDTHRDIRA